MYESVLQNALRLTRRLKEELVAALSFFGILTRSGGIRNTST